MTRTLFILRTFNDIDHISPVIWKFIQKGEHPIILFHSSYDYESDYRIQFLRKTGEIEIFQKPDFEFERIIVGIGSEHSQSLLRRLAAKWYLRKRNPHSIIGKLKRRFFFDCSVEMDWLRDKNVSAIVFEWNNPTGRGEILEKYFISAKALGIPTFSIPHGCNIYLNSDIHDGYRKYMAKGRLPNFKDRNAFDYYVVQSRYHLEHFVRFGLQRSKIQAWGSTRFSPEWQEINLSLCQKFEPEKEVGNRLKIVFMLPHWNYNVDKQKTLALLDKIANLDWVFMVVKDHTRGAVGLLPVYYQLDF
jgi:hypothetical protein